MQTTETILWKKFISGDEEAFSRLYKSCYRDLYAYGISLGMDRESIKDAIQDIFLIFILEKHF